MKWFKHLVASTSDPDLIESEIHFGSLGPYVFWRTLEILAREDAHKQPLTINIKVLRLSFPSISKRKFAEILAYFDKKKRFQVSYHGDDITIFCKKLQAISAPYAAAVATNLQQTCDPVVTIEVEGEREVEKAASNKEPTTEATGFERIDIELCGESMPWIQVSSWVSRLKGNYQLAWQLLYYAAVVRKAEHPARYVQKLVNEGEYAMAQEVKVDTALDWRDSLYATKEN